MLAAAIDEDELESIRKRRNKVEMAMDEEVAIAERMYDIIDSTIKDVGESTGRELTRALRTLDRWILEFISSRRKLPSFKVCINSDCMKKVTIQH